MIKVLGVNGSPRKYGASARLLAIALRGAELEGAETHKLDLCEYDLRPCVGCFSDSPDACREPCPIDDEWDLVYKRVLESDVLIVSTPVYWYAPSSQVKMFIDRLTVLENKSVVGRGNPMEGKVAGVVATGLEEGASQAGYYVAQALNSMGFILPPYSVVHYTGLEDPAKLVTIVRDAINLGMSVVKLARLVKDPGLGARWYANLDPGECERVSREAVTVIEREEPGLRSRREEERARHRALKFKRE